MKILIDMNLSPEWVAALDAHGFPSQHWVTVGAPNAPDTELLNWARDHSQIVLTHDLDFGEILAATNARGPSVIQVRTQDVAPAALADYLVGVLRQFEDVLNEGALVTVDREKARARVLPIRPA